MGQEHAAKVACCGNERNQSVVNTEISREQAGQYGDRRQIDKVQRQLNNSKNEIQRLMQRYAALTDESTLKYNKLNEQYESEIEQKARLMHQLQVCYISIYIFDCDIYIVHCL